MQKFRKLDIFKKVPKDLSQGTNLGGLVSILTALTIIFFLYKQFQMFFNPQKACVIDLSNSFTRKQLNINLDIQFRRFPCQIIALDLQDQMMSHHPNIGSVKKYRLNSEGQMIDQGTDFQLLREPDMFKQYQMAQQAFKKNYGCRLIGSFTVKQVPGNFHISSHSYQSIYMRLMMSDIIKTLDVSHKINFLYFGDYNHVQSIEKAHPQAQLTPLNGHKRIYDMNTPHSYNSHYHIDIVPTLYLDTYSDVRTYQYTYNHNSFQVRHMPCLYFNYHIQGTQVVFYNKRGVFTSFLLNLCAVIGGIYAIAHFIYNTLFALTGKNYGYQELAR